MFMILINKIILKMTSKIFWKCISITIVKVLFTIILTFLPIIITFIKSFAQNLDIIITNGIQLEQISQDIQGKITFYSLYTYIYAFLVPPLVTIFTKKETSKWFSIITCTTCLIMALFIALINENIVLTKRSLYVLILFSVIPIFLLSKSIFNDEEECLKYYTSNKAIEDIASNSDNLRGKNE